MPRFTELYYKRQVMLDIRTENTTKLKWSRYQSLHNIVAIKSREKEFSCKKRISYEVYGFNTDHAG